MGESISGYQPKEKRTSNFGEVALGVTKKIASEEARRCPQCADPVCAKACPLGIDIPGFVRLLREGQVSAAYERIKEQNWLPAICGRICSAPCEVACVLNEEKAPIGIRTLERYAADLGKPKFLRARAGRLAGKKIAIIGSGPAGLTAAAELAKHGYQVTVFESLDHPGGVLRYGIPEFRIPKKVVESEIQEIKALGVEIETNFFIGQTMTVEEIFKKGFSAVLLATGAGVPKFMDLPGTNLGGVYYGEEFLMRVNLIKSNLFSGVKPNFPIGSKVAVIGSGNTALDCARAARRFGREVTMIFRRTEEDLRIRGEEQMLAKEEGVRFESLVKPIEIKGNNDNFVRSLKCIRMDYAVGENNQYNLVAVPDSEFDIEADTVVMAIGHNPNTLVAPEIQRKSDGTFFIDAQTGMTSYKGVFACGNVVTNAGPVVEAMASGKKVAEKIHQYLK